MLKSCMTSNNFSLRIAVAEGLAIMHQPLQPEWLTPLIRNFNGAGDEFRNFHEALKLLRMYGNDDSARAMVECLQFDNPALNGPRNFWILLWLDATKGGPKYYYKWHHDANTPGSEQERADNAKILAELKVWLEKQSGK